MEPVSWEQNDLSDNMDRELKKRGTGSGEVRELTTAFLTDNDWLLMSVMFF